MPKILQLISVLLFFVTISGQVYSQNSEEEFIEKIVDYKLQQKEVAYLHLNKSHYLKNEQLGFTAYVLNEFEHTSETNDSNLYITVKNEKDSLIRRDMYLIKNGITSGVIDIDSTFKAGNYTITAFTKHMLNFDEPYHFAEDFKVLSTNSETKKSEGFPAKIDVQFLPESGHFLNNTINNVGVIATDSLGQGLGNGKVLIKDENAEILSIVDLNRFGIGKFSFIPKKSKSYTAVLAYKGKEVPVLFSPEIDSEGLVLNVSEKESELEILIKTNDHSLPFYQSEKFILVAQDNENFYNFDINFKDFTTASVLFNLNELAPGMNIFTLFNEEMQPIAERLYFNHTNFDVETPKTIQTTAIEDSLQISIPFYAEKEGKLSVSILPKNTISYQRNHNILSYIHLKPYIKGDIENAAWYFTNIDPGKKHALDNLLLTRGWSSYNWEKIFNKNIPETYVQDKFSFKATIADRDLKRKELRYMVHSDGNNPPNVFKIPQGIDSFSYDEYIPVSGESLKISRIARNDNLMPAKLRITFAPNDFPEFNIASKPFPLKSQKLEEKQSERFYRYEGLNAKAELLDEVILSAKIERPIDRARKLGKNVFTKIMVISEKDLNLFMHLKDLLKGENLIVNDKPEDFWVATTLANMTHSKGGIRTMQFYLDDMPMPNYMFYVFPLTQVDYIEINKTGIGEGIMASNGTIKVYTKRDSHFSSSDINRIQEFKIPLAYTKDKEYYVPKYENTSDEFFQNYGVIDWKPQVRFEKGKAAVINIKKPEVDYQLIIEGVTSEGDLIHSVQQVQK
jgi:hypothetical protein